MRIIQLTAENFKRLTAVDIKPDGDIVVVSGKNGAGKTSVLDAIWLALGGGPAGKSTKRPVRDGAEKAEVTLDLDDLKVTRTWKGDKTTLTVTSKNGSRYSSPQAMLDGLIGRLSFDPLEFAQQDEKSQLKTLLSLVELPFQPDELDAQRQQVFDRRTEINRVVKELTAQLKGMPEVEAPDEEVSATDVITSIRNAEEWQHIAKTKKMNLEAKLQQIVETEQLLARLRTQAQELQAEVDQLPNPMPDPTVYTGQLEQLETINRAVRAKQERARIASQLEVVTTDATELTKQLDQIDTYRKQSIESAAMPIAGLGFDEDGVTYGGVPFKQASSAEQLKVSVAMAMALNPTVRVIRITDGSLLDSDNMGVIADMAGRHDFQVWVERVDESGDLGVVIEDGHVKA